MGGGGEAAGGERGVAAQEEEESCDEVEEAQRDGGVPVGEHSHCQLFLVVFSDLSKSQSNNLMRVVIMCWYERERERISNHHQRHHHKVHNSATKVGR